MSNALHPAQSRTEFFRTPRPPSPAKSTTRNLNLSMFFHLDNATNAANNTNNGSLSGLHNDKASKLEAPYHMDVSSMR